MKWWRHLPAILIALLVASSMNASPAMQIIIGVAILAAYGLGCFAAGRIWQYGVRHRFFKLSFEEKSGRPLEAVTVEPVYDEMILHVEPRHSAGMLKNIDIRFVRPPRWRIPWRNNRHDFCSRITGIRRPRWSGDRYKTVKFRAQIVPGGVQLTPEEKIEWDDTPATFDLQICTHAKRKARISVRAEIDGAKRHWGSAKIKVDPRWEDTFYEMLAPPPLFEDNLLDGVMPPQPRKKRRL